VLERFLKKTIPYGAKASLPCGSMWKTLPYSSKFLPKIIPMRNLRFFEVFLLQIAIFIWLLPSILIKNTEKN